MKTIKAGDILTSSWGWEQTNVSFYKVLKRTPKQVQLQEIGAKKTESDTLAMQGTSVPDESVKRSGTFRKKVSTSYTGDEEMVGIESYELAKLWDGTPEKFTSYA